MGYLKCRFSFSEFVGSSRVWSGTASAAEQGSFTCRPGGRPTDGVDQTGKMAFQEQLLLLRRHNDRHAVDAQPRPRPGHARGRRHVLALQIGFVRAELYTLGICTEAHSLAIFPE